MSTPKHKRIFDLTLRLLDGEVINKQQAAERYGINERSVQRDIDDLRAFFSEQVMRDGGWQDVVYDRKQKGFRLYRQSEKDLTNGEALAVSKVLLESRAFTKVELSSILDKIVNGCVPKENYPQVAELIANEKYFYIPPRHGQDLVDRLWDIGAAVREQRYMQIEYVRMKDPAAVRRLVRPVGIMFSEFYFYLTAFIENIDREREFQNADDVFPTIYRIDRIQSFKVLDEHFTVPYTNRFQEGEFRKRVQFMYGGRLQKIKFTYSGPSVEAVLDRLPTAQVMAEADGVYTVCAEVFGQGIDMWLRSQGDAVRVLE